VAAPFSVGDAFNWGWNKFQQNAGVIILAALIYVVALAVIEVIFFFIFSALLLNTSSSPTFTTNPTTGQITATNLGSAGTSFFVTLLFGAILAFCLLVVITFAQAALIRGALSVANGQKLELSTMLKFDRAGQIALGAVIVAAATAVGYLLCFVGALVVAFFTPFWLFFLLDKNLGAVDALKASISLVNKHIGSVVLLILGVIVAYLVGVVLCFIGLIVTLPVALLALTYGFRRLQNEAIAA
jgi:uncharacterized membrane protein